MQDGATVLAVLGVGIVAFAAAGEARLRRHRGSRPLRDGGRDNSGRHRDDRVANQHQDHGGELPGGRLRRDVAVTDRRNRHDRPVHPSRDGREAALFPFDEVQQSPHHYRNRHDRGQEDDNLRPALAQRVGQLFGSYEIVPELQDPEDADEPQHPDRDQRLSARQHQTDPGGEDRQQVDHPEETEDVARRMPHRRDAREVLDGEQEGERPLDAEQQRPELRADARQALDHHHRDASDDRHQQRDVEQLPAACVRFEDDLVQPEAPAKVDRTVVALEDPARRPPPLYCQHAFGIIGARFRCTGTHGRVRSAARGWASSPR